MHVGNLYGHQYHWGSLEDGIGHALELTFSK